jgi:hypothetical protein
MVLDEIARHHRIGHGSDELRWTPFVRQPEPLLKV